MLLPKLLLAAEMPRSMLPAGDANAFDGSTRMTRASIESAAMPTSQMKHCVEMMSCAPQAKKFCTKEAKIAPKLRAQEWPLRAAAKLPVPILPKRKLTVEVSEVGQGQLGSGWRARSLTVENGGMVG